MISVTKTSAALACVMCAHATDLFGTIPKKNLNLWRPNMRPAIHEEERPTEDDIARRKLGPRGVPGGEDYAKMTPQQEKNMPKTGAFDGHTA
jgi:hypothetical protein